MKLLHLLPDFGYHAAARQVSLLAPALRSLRVAPEVHVAALDSGRRWELTAWRHLDRLLDELRPDVVHAWRLPALRAAGVLGALARRRPCRLVVSEPRRGGRWTAFDRRILLRVVAAVAGHPAEADALRRLGLPAGRVHVLPPAVAPAPGPPAAPDIALPPGARVILGVGSLTPAHGFREAIWAFDILKYVYPDLHLLIVGDGPERDRLEQFARSVGRGDARVHFLPARPHAAALLPHAAAVWVPSRSDGGRQVVLEAQAAGRPVLAAARPALAALVADGATGLLAPPGDPVAWAAAARRLLDDPALAGRLGNAARRAAAGLAPERVAPAYARLYEAA